MKTDIGGTIAKVAATGYKEVEFAGYYDHSPKEIRELLDKDGLVAPSCHVGYDVVEKKWSEALEAAKIVGHSYIICPWIDEKQRTGPDGWKRAADLFNKAGEESQKAGDRKSTRLNSSHVAISYAVFCLKKKNNIKVRSLNIDNMILL